MQKIAQMPIVSAWVLAAATFPLGFQVSSLLLLVSFTYSHLWAEGQGKHQKSPT